MPRHRNIACAPAWPGLLACLLGGCASGPAVEKADVGTTTKFAAAGVLYSLPKTALELRLKLLVENLKAGELDPYLECKAGEPDCVAKTRYGLKKAEHSSRPSIGGSTANASCRIYLADDTDVVPLSYPDTDHVYFVRLSPRWWEKVDVDLEWSDAGQISKTGFTASSPLKDVVDSAISIFRPNGWKSSLVGARPEEVNVARLHDETRQAIQKIRERRNAIVMGTAADRPSDLAPLLQELEKREARLFDRYRGTLQTTAIALTKRAPEIQAGASSATLQVEVPDYCAEDSTKVSPLQFNLVLVADGANYSVAKLGERLVTTQAPAVGGFRVRSPVPVSVKLKSLAGADLSDRDWTIPIAQLGPVVELPRRIGLRGGALSAGIVPQTGGLKSLSTKSGDAPTIQVLGSVSSAAAKDREIAELERQAKKLELEKKIRDLEAAAPAQ